VCTDGVVRRMIWPVGSSQCECCENIITVDGLVGLNLAREHGSVNKGDADKKKKDVVYEVSA